MSGTDAGKAILFEDYVNASSAKPSQELTEPQQDFSDFHTHICQWRPDREADSSAPDLTQVMPTPLAEEPL